MLTLDYTKAAIIPVNSICLFIRKPFFLFCSHCAKLNLCFDLIYKLGQNLTVASKQRTPQSFCATIWLSLSNHCCESGVFFWGQITDLLQSNKSNHILTLYNVCSMLHD